MERGRTERGPDPSAAVGPDPAGQAEAREQDARLVGQALAGEPAAFDELVRRHERRALAVAYRLLNQAADAQEVVQEALLRAFRALDTLANAQLFGPWLLRIVTNLALNMRRARGRRPAVSLDEVGRSAGRGQDSDDRSEPLIGALAPEQAGPAEQAMADELQERIRQALDELPERQRMALTLFSMEQMPQKEVAEVLGCSVEAVKWHVFAARKKLKESLSDLLDDSHDTR